MGKKNIYLMFLIFIILALILYLLNANSDTSNTRPSNNIASNKTRISINKNIQSYTPPVIENTLADDTAEADSSDEVEVDNYNNTPLSNLEQLNQHIEKNDLCSLDKKRFSLLDIASMFSNFKTASPLKESDQELMDELIGTNSALLKGDNPTDGKHPAIRFYYALFLADLISGMETQNQKYNTANDILTDLTNSYPENGAYPYYKAFVLSKMNAQPEQIKETFIKAFNASAFDTHLQTITKIIFEQSLNRPSQFVVGLSFIYSLPIPNSTEPLNLLKKIIESNDPNFNKHVTKFAEKISDISKIKVGSVEFVHYNMLEIAIGYSLKSKVHIVEFPNKPRLPKPSVREILEKFSPSHKKYLSFLDEIAKDCSSPNINNHFKVIQDDYTAFLNVK